MHAAERHDEGNHQEINAVNSIAGTKQAGCLTLQFITW